MKNIYIISVGLLLLSGCREGEPNEVRTTLPWNLEATLEFTAAVTQYIDNGEAAATFNFTSSQEHFTVTADRPWCRTEVQDNNKLVVTANPNPYNNIRVARVTVVAGIYDNVTAPKTLQVWQEAGSQSIPQVGELYGDGVVYWASAEPDTAGFRVMSLKRQYGINAQWSAEMITTGAKDPKYGASNRDRITDISSYPAFYFCDTLSRNKGQGWYLPARDEFNDIMKLYNGGTMPAKGLPSAAEQTKRAAFETFLTANGGDPFNGPDPPANGQSYWTSTESDWETATYVRVWNYAVATGSKSSSARGARCVQYFDLR